MDAIFMANLQAFRDECGFAFTIDRGVSCPEHNQQVGGKPDSRHLVDPSDNKSHAADILIPSDLERYIAILHAPKYFQGIGIGKSMIHVDNRVEHSFVCWTYYSQEHGVAD